MKTSTRLKSFLKFSLHIDCHERDSLLKSTILNHTRDYRNAATRTRGAFCKERAIARWEEKLFEWFRPINTRLDGKRGMSVSTKGSPSGQKKPNLPNSTNQDCPPETDLPHYHRFRSFNSNEEAKEPTSDRNTVSSAAAAASLSGSGGGCENKQKISSAATSSSGSKPLKADNKYIANSVSDSKSSGGINKGSSSSDSERAIYQEKQSSYRVDFSKVRSAPPPSRQQWWYPDPYTGYYTPEDHFGETFPAPPEEKPKKKKNVTVVLKDKRAPGTKGSLWWTSMEDLPDSLS